MSFGSTTTKVQRRSPAWAGAALAALAAVSLAGCQGTTGESGGAQPTSSRSAPVGESAADPSMQAVSLESLVDPSPEDSPKLAGGSGPLGDTVTGSTGTSPRAEHVTKVLFAFACQGTGELTVESSANDGRDSQTKNLACTEKGSVVTFFHGTGPGDVPAFRAISKGQVTGEFSYVYKAFTYWKNPKDDPLYTEGS